MHKAIVEVLEFEKDGPMIHIIRHDKRNYFYISKVVFYYIYEHCA